MMPTARLTSSSLWVSLLRAFTQSDVGIGDAKREAALASGGLSAAGGASFQHVGIHRYSTAHGRSLMSGALIVVRDRA